MAGRSFTFEFLVLAFTEQVLKDEFCDFLLFYLFAHQIMHNGFLSFVSKFYKTHHIVIVICSIYRNTITQGPMAIGLV